MRAGDGVGRLFRWYRRRLSVNWRWTLIVSGWCVLAPIVAIGFIIEASPLSRAPHIMLVVGYVDNGNRVCAVAANPDLRYGAGGYSACYLFDRVPAGRMPAVGECWQMKSKYPRTHRDDPAAFLNPAPGECDVTQADIAAFTMSRRPPGTAADCPTNC